MAVDYQVLHYFPVWCAKVGVKHAVICSGSRSAPLALSFSHYDSIQCHYAIDERSAGYMALGMSQETKSPVVVIVTSGTAVANLYPAVAEAYYSHTPLFVLSADRPPESAFQYEGQSMFQQRIFGDHVLSFVQCCQTTHPKALEWLRVQFTEAVSKSLGTRNGPVHFNFPFEEPFYPSDKTSYPEVTEPFYIQGPTSAPVIFPEPHVYKRALLVLGRMGAASEILHWARQYNIPVLADITCGALIPQELQIHSFEILLRNGGRFLPEPDIIISTGRGLVSKILKKYIQGLTTKTHIYIPTGGEKQETTGTATHILNITANDLDSFKLEPDPEYIESWRLAGRAADAQLQKYISEAPYSEMKAMSIAMKAIPEGYKIHSGNSMAVRWAHLFLSSRVVYCNRGVSGIDGSASTFMGAALVSNQPMVLITGDVSFFYDLNAFWQESLPAHIKVIILNNFGGGIFRLIEGPSRLPEREEVFVMPRKRDISMTVASIGLEYFKATDETSLTLALENFFHHPGAAVLEIVTDPEINGRVFELYREIE